MRDIDKLWEEAKRIIDEYKLGEMDIKQYQEKQECEVLLHSDSFLEAEANLKVQEDLLKPVETQMMVEQVESNMLDDELEKLER